MIEPADLLAKAGARDAVPVRLVAQPDAASALGVLGASHAAWAHAQDFDGRSGQLVLLPDGEGALAGALFGLGGADSPPDPFLPGKLATLLPEGLYAFAGPVPEPRLAALAWLLEAYRFDRYRSRNDSKPARLVAPAGVDRADLVRQAEAVAWIRDLVNTPAGDLGPAELEAAARSLARKHRARVRTLAGDALLGRGLAMIHAVGRASERGPRLIDLTWGDARCPKVTLVGKGVCFDTGGLDIKPSSNMLLMKKDMGGAAHVLGLAQLVMAAGIPVRLRVLVPAVENAISGAAFRPGDVLASHKGLTVEIGNTDAEGRLVLADALSLADAEEPDLLIDMATLTGAARVALGPDLPPFYTEDDVLAAEIARHGDCENDPVWRMPLWRPYAALLDSKVADLNNVAEGGFAGSVIAALFLRRFVERAKRWVHFDIFAWTPRSKPGRPAGAEAQAVRLLYALIAERYGRGSKP